MLKETWMASILPCVDELKVFENLQIWSGKQINCRHLEISQEDKMLTR